VFCFLFFLFTFVPCSFDVSCFSPCITPHLVLLLLTMVCYLSPCIVVCLFWFIAFTLHYYYLCGPLFCVLIICPGHSCCVVSLLVGVPCLALPLLVMVFHLALLLLVVVLHLALLVLVVVLCLPLLLLVISFALHYYFLLWFASFTLFCRSTPFSNIDLIFLCVVTTCYGLSFLTLRYCYLFVEVMYFPPLLPFVGFGAWSWRCCLKKIR
jgi:hypothetical protein